MVIFLATLLGHPPKIHSINCERSATGYDKRDTPSNMNSCVYPASESDPNAKMLTGHKFAPS